MVVPQLSFHTPIGSLTISQEGEHIVALDWGWGRDQAPSALLTDVVHRLQAYFDGTPIDFADLPLRPEGTAYRQRIWSELRRIPRGATRSYQQIAQAAGGSARSVGQASGANPIPILIPCHRVVAVQGPGGYSGEGGLDVKRHLLQLEGASMQWETGR